SKTNPEIQQNFSMTTRIWANIITVPNKWNILKFEVDLYDCKMGEMLSNKWPSLGKQATAYFLDSIEIRVSPNPLKVGMIVPRNYKPQQPNQVTEYLEGDETNKGFDCQFGGEIGTTSKIGIQGKISCDTKNAHSTKSIMTSKWKLGRQQNCHYANIALHDMKLKPKILKQYPKMVHTLEISFKSIKNFNKDFAALNKQQFIHGDLIVTLGDDKGDKLGANDTKHDSEIMDIERKPMQTD
ncbi:19645_t:CDS:2, partial [Racocetra persica]